MTYILCGLPDILRMLLGGLHEFIHARRAAELVSLAADDPGELGVGLGLGDGADAIAGPRMGSVARPEAFELLGRSHTAVGVDVCGRVLAAGFQVQPPFLLGPDPTRHVALFVPTGGGVFKVEAEAIAGDRDGRRDADGLPQQIPGQPADELRCLLGGVAGLRLRLERQRGGVLLPFYARISRQRLLLNVLDFGLIFAEYVEADDAALLEDGLSVVVVLTDGHKVTAMGAGLVSVFFARPGPCRPGPPGACPSGGWSVAGCVVATNQDENSQCTQA